MNIVYMYFTTDGDSGYYGIKLFGNEAKAKQYAKEKHDAYGSVEPVEVDMSTVELDSGNVKCPECGGKMVSRKGQYGIFWGCLDYPKCRGTRDNMGRSKAERDAERNRTSDSDDRSSSFDRSSENDKFRFRKN